MKTAVNDLQRIPGETEAERKKPEKETLEDQRKDD